MVRNKMMTFIGISLIIQTLIVAGLLIFGTSKAPEQSPKPFDFDELYVDYTGLPSLNSYQTRNNSHLSYRHYKAESNTVLVLLHGSAWHSQYFFPLAQSLASQGIAQVYTPDLRGHGNAPARRGDIDYIEQFEDDIADLLHHIRQHNPEAKIVLGGHSSGGGLALRFAGSQYGQQVDAYFLLAPFLKYNAPTMRENAGGWARPHMGRIIGLSMLNAVGIRYFNYLTAIEFDMPKAARNGTETLAYSYRLNTGYAPSDYKADLQAITQPLLLAIGGKDEAFKAEEFDAVIRQHAKSTQAEVKWIPNVSHMGIVVGGEVISPLRDWLGKL